MNTLLIDTLKQISQGELLQTSPICFLYNGIEYEFSIDDEEQQRFVVSAIVYKKKNLTHNEVVMCMIAYMTSDGYRWTPALEYVLDKNEEDSTYNFTLYAELCFHFSESIKNKMNYLQSSILNAMNGRIDDYYEMMDIVKTKM